MNINSSIFILVQLSPESQKSTQWGIPMAFLKLRGSQTWRDTTLILSWAPVLLISKMERQRRWEQHRSLFSHVVLLFHTVVFSLCQTSPLFTPTSKGDLKVYWIPIRDLEPSTSYRVCVRSYIDWSGRYSRCSAEELFTTREFLFFFLNFFDGGSASPVWLTCRPCGVLFLRSHVSKHPGLGPHPQPQRRCSRLQQCRICLLCKVRDTFQMFTHISL